MKKGDFEVNEMFVVFLIIAGIVAAAVILQVSTNSVGEILENSIWVIYSFILYQIFVNLPTPAKSAII